MSMPRSACSSTPKPACSSTPGHSCSKVYVLVDCKVFVLSSWSTRPVNQSARVLPNSRPACHGLVACQDAVTAYAASDLTARAPQTKNSVLQ